MSSPGAVVMETVCLVKFYPLGSGHIFLSPWPCATLCCHVPHTCSLLVILHMSFPPPYPHHPPFVTPPPHTHKSTHTPHRLYPFKFAVYISDCRCIVGNSLSYLRQPLTGHKTFTYKLQKLIWDLSTET